MTVRFSCRCPNADYLGFEATPEGIIAAAVKAEELGFNAVFVNDHIVVDNTPRLAPWTNNPFVALSFIAANTTRIDVGISVLIVSYRTRSPQPRCWPGSTPIRRTNLPPPSRTSFPTCRKPF